MAGARRSRRKSGQDDPGDTGQLLDEGLGPEAGDSDLDADQWLTPFRTVQSIKPVISQRVPQAQPPQAPPPPHQPPPHQAPPHQPPPQPPLSQQPQAPQPNAAQYGQPRASWHDAEAERLWPGSEQRPRYEQEQRAEPEPKVHRVWSGPEPLPEFGPDRPGWSPQIRPDDRRRLSRQSAMGGSFSGRPADPLIGRPVPPPGRQNVRGRGQSARGQMAGPPDGYGQAPAPGYGPPEPGYGAGDRYGPGQQHRPREDYRHRGDGYPADGGYAPAGHGPEAEYGPGPGPGPGPGAGTGYGPPGGYRGDGRGPRPDEYRQRDGYRPRDDYHPGVAYGPRDGFGSDPGGYGPGPGYAPGGPGRGAYGPGNGYGYGPGERPDRGYRPGGHQGDQRRPVGDQYGPGYYGPGNGYDPCDRYGPVDPRRGDGYRPADGYGYGPPGPPGPYRGGYPPDGDYQRGGYRQRDDYGPPPDYYRRGEEYARPPGYPPHPADDRYRQGWQAPADDYRDFSQNGPYPGPQAPRGPFDQAGRGYSGRADHRWPGEGFASDGYGQGAPGFDGEIRSRPPDASAWSRPGDRAFDDRPQPPPAQRNRPPAALPAGPSASVAEPDPGDSMSAFDFVTSAEAAGVSPPSAPDAPAAVPSAPVHATDGATAETEAAEIQPPAVVASPTGTVRPPPVTEVAQTAPPVPLPLPLPLGKPITSAPAGPPAFGAADGGDVGPDDDTAPLPVIFPDQMPDEAVPSARMRDPFEPIDRQPDPLPRRVPAPAPAAATAPSPAVTPDAVKMDQIKDLYLTAEAIGDDALGEHFQQVSDRQRQLIREYFDQVAARGAEEQPKN